MDKLYTKLETVALKTITSGEKIADWLFPRLQKEHFSLDPSQEFFRRIRVLTHKSGHLPDWEDLLADIAVSEETREFMESAREGIIYSRRNAERLIGRLEEYRQVRVLFGIQKMISKELRQTKVNIPTLNERVADQLARARSNADWSNQTITFGGKQIDKKGILKVIRERTYDFIPTGFKAFDSVNLGVPRSSVFVLAGETGAGKCLAFDVNLVTSEGIKQIGELYESLTSPVNSDGSRIVDRPIFMLSHTGKKRRAVRAFKTRGKQIRITFSNGEVIRGRPEHMLWVFDSEGKLKFRRLDEIQIGDCAPLHNAKLALAQLLNKSV